jgi:hypothetical protein
MNRYWRFYNMRGLSQLVRNILPSQSTGGLAMSLSDLPRVICGGLGEDNR